MSGDFATVDDLSTRITIRHGGTTVTTLIGEHESDIHSVVEAIDYALRGIGFDVDIIHGAFAQYAPAEQSGSRHRSTPADEPCGVEGCRICPAVFDQQEAHDA